MKTSKIAFFANMIKDKFVLSLVMITLILLFSFSFIDFQLTKWLIDQRTGNWNRFANFVHETVFQNGVLGLTDFILIFLVIWIFYLFKQNKSLSNPEKRNRNHSIAFIFTNILWLTISIVQGLKYLVGRARPYEVFGGNLEYSPWYQLGDHYSHQQIIFQGSFPSGHVMSIACLFGFSYLFTHHKGRAHQFLSHLFVLSICCITVLGRSMHGAHWVTDGVASTLFAWIFTHIHFKWHQSYIENRRNVKNYLIKSIIYILLVGSCGFLASLGLRFL